jgi:hypothetical protein
MAEDTRPARRPFDTEGEGTVGRPKRQRLPPFETVLPEKTDSVLSHWRRKAPVTDDSPQALDVIATRMIPQNDRNCAAVYQPADGSLPLVAMNQWERFRVEGGGEQNYPQIYAPNAYTAVHDTTAQLHAEMKILQHHFAAGPYSGPNFYIGISKPSCLRCAVVMRIQGFSSRGCSGGLWDAGWVIPGFVRNSPLKLKEFLGSEVYDDWYALLDRNTQAQFLSQLQNLTDQ